MRALPVLAAVALVGSACGAAHPPSRVGDEPRTVSRYGISIAIPPGWDGEIRRGIVRAANRPLPVDRADLTAADVVIELLERGGTDGAFVPTDLPLSLRSADFDRPPRDWRTPEMHGVVWRSVLIGDRPFVVWVESGARPPSEPLVAEVNELLASLSVASGDFYPGSVHPAAFEPAEGWRTGSDGRFEREPWGEQTQSWAATVPWRDEPFALPPRRTIATMGRDDIVIWVGLSRSGHEPPLPVRPLPYRLADFEVREDWEGAVGNVPEYLLRTRVDGDYQVEVRIYFGRAQPTARMLAAAEAELARLRLPDWGPWELE